MRLEVLCFLIGVATAIVIKQPLTWKLSRRFDMIKRGVYKDYLKRMELLRATAPRKYPNKVLDYSDYEYVSNITIGTPQQQFVIVPDTGSADLWVPGLKCDDSCNFKHMFSESCNFKHMFAENASSTFIGYKTKWRIEYGEGDAKGVKAKDVVRFGGEDEPQLVIPNSTFGIANHISADFKEDPTDGVLGLAFSGISAIKGGPPLLNAIKQGQCFPLSLVFWPYKCANPIE
ncbi:unnamed protein product [Strongylus vulgaris]|uniref:Peptidase A1 domain-containing protein n=1 Tax=Strongylus vulgaris TaxID=40348 RepID=A0A3P7IKG4_STRVU|nr:unnamed protein product [Strongylus vulgaris]